MIIFRLDRLLAQHKMRGVELAEKLGCTVQTISRIKTGKIKALRIDTLDELCEIFHCQPGDIIEYIPDDEARQRYGDDFVEKYHRYLDE
ncbi:MAG TPA: helix-turn-helix transcriptional regulator [Candidatus Gordonibacter avicola]|nr:helix-turn-helix transcriptional regulator [Candidatus Gordonibacter avicola]